MAHRFILDLFEALQRLRTSLGRLYESAGLNEHKFLVLSALADQAPQPSLATELAGRARVTRSSMTTVLDDLEQRGWVERRRDPTDRRIIRVSLTPDGSAVVQAADQHFRQVCTKLLCGIDPRELPRFAALCKTVSEAGIALSRQATTFNLPRAKRPASARVSADPGS